MTRRWPEAFDELTRELRSDRGVPAVVDTTAPYSERLLQLLSERVDGVVSLGERVAGMAQQPTVAALLRDLPASVLLTDIDVLFWPAMHVNVAAQLRALAASVTLFVSWPGTIQDGRLSYSRPGRADHVDCAASGMLVLNPVDTAFPDEVPYTVERYPA